MGIALVLLAASAALVRTDTPVRSGCDSDDRQVAQIPAGVEVQIRSSMSGSGGACYKVAATVNGQEISGYVPGSALHGIESYDAARRAAKGMDGVSPAAITQQMKAAATPGASPHPYAQKVVDLIEANQPAEALRLAEEALGRVPNDPILLGVAGFAAYRMDQLDRAMLFWKDAQAIQPMPWVEGLMNRASREKSADKGSERMVGTRVQVRYERGRVSEATARAMLDALDEEYTRISFQLGCRASEKVTAVLQSREAYMQSTAAAEWSGGLFDGRIHVPVSQNDPRMREVFAHELVHACLHELGSWPSWLHEGLAQKYSGRRLAPPAQAELQAVLKSGALKRLSDLGQNWSRLSGEHARIAYALSLYAADRLGEMLVNTGIGNLLRNPADLPRVTAELEKKLGL